MTTMVSTLTMRVVMRKGLKMVSSWVQIMMMMMRFTPSILHQTHQLIHMQNVVGVMSPKILLHGRIYPCQLVVPYQRMHYSSYMSGVIHLRMMTPRRSQVIHLILPSSRKLSVYYQGRLIISFGCPKHRAVWNVNHLP